MKDVQGIHRGKCNSCECEEYRTSPSQSSLRCEYCNHTPVEHVKIIELGACISCGKDECDKYQSENPNKYTNCEYCGCSAQMHSGADKLRKPRPQGQQQPGASGQLMSQGSSGYPSFQPRHDAYDQPVQQPGYGECKCPGCKYPRRKEGGKIHDFCSRTCAKKYGDMQATFYQQKVAASVAAQSGSPKGSAKAQKPPGGSYTSSVISTSTGPTMLGYPSPPVPGGSLPPNPSQAPSAGGKLCSKCQARQANHGRSWCQQCYSQS